MYISSCDKAYINGQNGIYDGKISNPSVKYGRNSVANYQEYLNDYTQPRVEFPDLAGLSQLSEDKFEKKLNELGCAIDKLDESLNSLPPLDFEQKYMPDGKFDKMALMGAAYEEMGKRTSISTEELNASLKEVFSDQVSIDALDLNKDEKIDLAEYGASILLADILSTNSDELKISNVDGTITKDGQNAVLPYGNIKNYDIANKTYQAIYNAFSLDDAQNKFVSDSNNLIN